MNINLGAEINHLPPGAVNIVIALLVVALIIRNTTRKAPMKQNMTLGIILAAVGAYETYGRIQANGAKVGDLLIVVVSILIGFILAVIRAFTIHLWREDQVVYAQGSWITALLWIVGLGQHLLVDAFVASGLGSASLLLYFGAMILGQRFFLLQRARMKGLVVRSA